MVCVKMVKFLSLACAPEWLHGLSRGYYCISPDPAFSISDFFLMDLNFVIMLTISFKIEYPKHMSW